MVCTLPVAEVVEVVDDATVVVEDWAWIKGKEERRRAVPRKLTMFANCGKMCPVVFSNGYKNNAMDEALPCRFSWLCIYTQNPSSGNRGTCINVIA